MLISVDFEVEPGHRFYRFLAGFHRIFLNSGFKSNRTRLF